MEEERAEEFFEDDRTKSHDLSLLCLYKPTAQP